VNGTASDPVTLALTGALPFLVLAAAALALPTALLLLALYRRAVLRGMAGTGSAASAGVAPRPGTSPVLPLRIAVLPALAPPGSEFAATRGAALVYLAAGLCYAVIMTAAWLLATRDTAVGPTKLVFLFVVYAWPAVLAAVLCGAPARDTQRRWIGVYLSAFAAVVAYVALRNPQMPVYQFPLVWLITNGPATVLLYAFLARRVRAVGPLVLTFALVALVGAQLALSVVGANDAMLRAAVTAGGVVGLGGTGVFWATFALGFVVFAFAGWLVLRAIARGYARKRISDESVTIDSVFVLFAIAQSVSLVFEHWAWIASGAIAFAAYRAAVALGFRRAPAPARPARLLLLRVFALGPRSERLFDAIRKLWLRRGPIAMIAGPDLATSAVEPDEFLAFVSGRLARAFVADAADLDRRAIAMDLAPDPDGRFRVAEFFCHADTWQPTMLRLVRESDAVLMDLRSFSAQNRGCLYEIGRLLDAIDLERVVFVIDRTTDRAFLESSLHSLWAELAADSPNRRAAAPLARLMTVAGPTGREAKALAAHLLHAAGDAAAAPAGRATSAPRAA
jgi:hypothetical protein